MSCCAFAVNVSASASNVVDSALARSARTRLSIGSFPRGQVDDGAVGGRRARRRNQDRERRNRNADPEVGRHAASFGRSETRAMAPLGEPRVARDNWREVQFVELRDPARVERGSISEREIGGDRNEHESDRRRRLPCAGPGEPTPAVAIHLSTPPRSATAGVARPRQPPASPTAAPPSCGSCSWSDRIEGVRHRRRRAAAIPPRR